MLVFSCRLILSAGVSKTFRFLLTPREAAVQRGTHRLRLTSSATAIHVEIIRINDQWNNRVDRAGIWDPALLLSDKSQELCASSRPGRSLGRYYYCSLTSEDAPIHDTPLKRRSWSEQQLKNVPRYTVGLFSLRPVDYINAGCPDVTCSLMK